MRDFLMCENLLDVVPSPKNIINITFFYESSEFYANFLTRKILGSVLDIDMQASSPNFI